MLFLIRICHPVPLRCHLVEGRISSLPQMNKCPNKVGKFDFVNKYRSDIVQITKKRSVALPQVPDVEE